MYSYSLAWIVFVAYDSLYITASIRSLFPRKSSLVSVVSRSGPCIPQLWFSTGCDTDFAAKFCDARSFFFIARYYFGSCNIRRQLPQHQWVIHIVCVRSTIVGWIDWIRIQPCDADLCVCATTWRCHEQQEFWTREDSSCRLLLSRVKWFRRCQHAITNVHLSKRVWWRWERAKTMYHFTVVGCMASKSHHQPANKLVSLSRTQN
jgi:hypothetical protein